MNASPPGAVSAPPAPDSAPERRFPLKRVVLLAAGGLIGIIVLLFVITLLLAANNIEQTEQVIRLLRDLMIIFLALEGILIILALAVLILQIAQLVNVLQNEVKPILENTRDAAETANTTVQFVSKQVTGPLVAAGGFLAALSSLLSSLFGIRRAVRHTREEEGSDG